MFVNKYLNLKGYNKKIFDLQKQYKEILQINEIGQSEENKEEKSYPVYILSNKQNKKKDKVLIISAGVHGNEHIGIVVLLNFIDYFLKDKQEILKKLNIYFLPILNPWGVQNKKRTNINRVDLNRNGDILSRWPRPMYAGQKNSKYLPWFMGQRQQMESRIYLDFFKEDIFKSYKKIYLIDLHSGFGFKDHLWTPYAGLKKYPEDWQKYKKIKEKLFKEIDDNIIFKPSFKSYSIKGDLLDTLYRYFHKNKKNNQLFLPFCLEIGSWGHLLRYWGGHHGILDIFNPKEIEEVVNKEKNILDKLIINLDF